MTVRDALKAVGAEGKWLVSYRVMIAFPKSKHKVDAWIGSCGYQDGKLFSSLLGDDSYSLDEEIERYEIATDLVSKWDGVIVVYLKLE